MRQSHALTQAQQDPGRKAAYEAAIRLMQDREEKSGREGFMGAR